MYDEFIPNCVAFFDVTQHDETIHQDPFRVDHNIVDLRSDDFPQTTNKQASQQPK